MKKVLMVCNSCEAEFDEKNSPLKYVEVQTSIASTGDFFKGDLCEPCRCKLHNHLCDIFKRTYAVAQEAAA